MLSLEEQKIVMRAIRTEAIIAVSNSDDTVIRKINESEIFMRDFIVQIWENAIRLLRSEGQAELCESQKLTDFDYQHRTRTVMGNMAEALRDLKDLAPVSIDVRRLQLWDLVWNEQRVKSKRMKALDAEKLPKSVRIAQDRAAGGASSQPDVSGTGTIMRTIYNSECSMLVGIPHKGLIEGKVIGTGAFGTVREYTVQGISFLPQHITYCGKQYKGDTSARFESFQAEQGMQLLHPSIVRCIAFTKEPPWITIFPLYNGGSLGDLLLCLPYRHSEFTKAMFRLDQGWSRVPPPDKQLSHMQLTRLKEVVKNMPHIMHALVDGLKAAHMAGIIHSDFHPFNIVLDFTKEEKPRIGIIDWGLLLRTPSKRISLNYVFEAAKYPDRVAEAESMANRERPKRRWLAPELYDPFLADAYTEASDVYALGYLFQVLHEFWRKSQELWMDGSSLDKASMEAILSKVRNWMLLEKREERKSLLHIAEFFNSLPTEPARVQRPLVELSVSYF